MSLALRRNKFLLPKVIQKNGFQNLSVFAFHHRSKKIRRERVRRKVANHDVFPMICGSGGWKSRLAKAAGAAWCGAIWPDERWKTTRRCGAKHRSKSKCTKHLSFGALLEVEMSKKCTPFWREVSKSECTKHINQCRTTFGSWHVEKMHGVVARSTFAIQNVQNTSVPDHFWKLTWRKKCTALWREDARSTFPSQNMFF